MSQPPAGGYPPPDSSQPGGYPPPAQPGPPAGGYPPPPAGGYQPQPDPAGYQPPQPGYQPPQPGYAPPPPGYQQPAGGYPPPAGGYPPPAGGYPPPAPGYQGGAPAFPPAGGSSGAGFDISKLGTVSRGILGASLLTLIGSFFNFWSVSVSGYGSSGLSGWSLWWWIPVVLAIAVGVVYALTLFGQLKPGQVKPEHLFYGAAASFVLMIFVLIHTFVYDGPGGIFDSDIDGLSSGSGFGVWFVLIATLVLTYFTAVAATNAGAKLPFKVPGPSLN